MKALDLIDPNTTIITPNRRLSAWLMAQYDQQQAEAGRLSWKTPRILPYDTWLSWHYQQAVDEGHCQKLLLSDTQADLIWQQILKTPPLAESISQAQQTARLASSAFRLLQQWLLPLDHPAFQDSIDYQAFQGLARHYIEQLASQEYLDSSQLYLELEETILQNTDSIALFGFAEFTAEQQRLIDRLRSSNKTVIINALHHLDDPQLERLSLKDANEELKAMARFCRQALTDNPQQTIGCVIPNLNSLRDTVETVFRRLIPGKFNISAAKPLTSYPVIHTALQCLTLNKPTLERETLSHLLKTPFIGFADTELSARMQLDARLSKQNIQTLSIPFLKQLSTQEAPLFFQLLSDFTPLTLKQPLSAWAQSFNQQLQALGWPGERELNSLEFQTVQRFYKLLDELSALELIQDACYFRDALALLTQLCQKTVFQGETDTQPVQILGSLEAAGLQFDTLWIAGLNDADWPALNPPHPFIPLRLQREKSLPHATANRTLQFYQTLSAQLFHASPRVILSYAKQIEGINYQASHLIRDYPASRLTLAEEEARLTALPCEDYPGEGLALQAFTIKGGTGYFKSQAACPFQAYALFRLKAESIPETYFGLDAADRGIIVHKALELLWKTLQSSQHLQTQTDSELRALIDHSIQQALEKTRLSAPLKHLETLRLQELLFDWLTLEKTRDDFKIKAIEKTEPASINGLAFTTRADRIDETADGQQLVIDYKTKKVTVRDWLSDRLTEPQLPIYALSDDAISNIAFAQVRRDELKFAMLEDVDWSQQKEIWREQLDGLAAEIKAGIASVTPRDALCCQHCELHSLCRIHEVAHDE